MGKAKKVTRILRREALITARECIAELLQPDKMVDAVCKIHGIAISDAENIVVQAWKEVRAADAGMSASDAKALCTHASYDLFYSAKRDKKYSAALQALRFIAQLNHLMRPETVLNDPTGAGAVRDEFAERTEEENLFFAQHGCWPEEHKPAPKSAGKKDPLASLH